MYDTTRLTEMAANGRRQAAKSPGTVGALLLSERADIYEGAVATIAAQAAEIERYKVLLSDAAESIEEMLYPWGTTTRAVAETRLAAARAALEPKG